MRDQKRKKYRLESQKQKNKTQTSLRILMIKSLIISMLITKIKVTRSLWGTKVLMGSIPVTQQRLEKISISLEECLVMIYRLNKDRLVDDKDTTNLCLAVARLLRIQADLQLTVLIFQRFQFQQIKQALTLTTCLEANSDFKAALWDTPRVLINIYLVTNFRMVSMT